MIDTLQARAQREERRPESDVQARCLGAWLALGGVCGALGVGLSAAGAHLPEQRGLGAAAAMCLAHAPAFVALAALETRMTVPRTLRAAGAVVAAGVLLFCADGLLRAFAGGRLFPMAAPLGGGLMIAGWTMLAVIGAVWCFKPARSLRG